LIRGFGSGVEREHSSSLKASLFKSCIERPLRMAVDVGLSTPDSGSVSNTCVQMIEISKPCYYSTVLDAPSTSGRLFCQEIRKARDEKNLL
jgi:hypothetical protein